MQTGKFNIVTDGQWGSCGKGLITSALAHRHRPQIISTTNMANAGHSIVNTDGTAYVAKALPSATILNRWLPDYQPQIVVGATAAFNLGQLAKEIEQCGVVNQLVIHSRAGVITEAHRLAEAGDGANSTKHIASTMQGCGTFLADKVLRKPDLKLARDYPELNETMVSRWVQRLPLEGREKLVNFSLPEILHALLLRDWSILHEGSQGFSLDINHGSHFPQSTSRGTTAIQNLADIGLPPADLGDIYLVIRPYPIRVGNVIENGQQLGYSGDCYEDQTELTWEQVAKEAGMPQTEAQALFQKELTTVTRRLRRVFSFSKQQLRQAALTNGATKLALNFANYIDWQVAGKNNWDDLTHKVNDFISEIEDLVQLPVIIVGTGPQLDHVVTW